MGYTVVISEFKLELQSWNAQYGSKSMIFLYRVTLKFDRWPWKTIGHLYIYIYATSSFVHNFKSIGEFKQELQSQNAQFGSKFAIFFVPCDLEIWRMTLQSNRAPILCHFNICASLHSHQWIQTRVTVRKCSNWGKICFDLYDFDLDILTFWPDITSVNGNHFRKFHDDLMTGTLRKGVTDGQTDGRTVPFLDLLGRS